MTDTRVAALETLAALEHDQWIEWSRTVAAQGLTPERLARWERYWVPYSELDEETKEHDRKWARLSLAALPADWCGHKAEIARLNIVGAEAMAQLARLRAIEVAARDHGVCNCEGGPRPIGGGRFYHYVGCDDDPALRAALAAKEATE